MSIEIIKGDCIDILETLKEKNTIVDAIIADPPYGTTDLSWDQQLDFDKLIPLLNSVLKQNGRLICFGNEPFYSRFLIKLLDSGLFSYSHELIWIKKNSSNPLLANQQPLRYHEKIMVLNKSRVGAENEKTDAYFYIQQLKKAFYNNKNFNDLKKVIGANHSGVGHYFTNAKQWFLMPKIYYENFIKEIKSFYKGDVLTYKDLKILNKNSNKLTYNPYSAFIVNRNNNEPERFDSLTHTKGLKTNKSLDEVINKTNYPKSYYICGNDYDKRHPTAKPLELVEHIVKMYTNSGDVILDFTMGSGTTGKAAKNLKRSFIGIEKNEEYFNYAKKWINE